MLVSQRVKNVLLDFNNQKALLPCVFHVQVELINLFQVKLHVPSVLEINFLTKRNQKCATNVPMDISTKMKDQRDATLFRLARTAV